ncbi:hypothetical protein [Halosimplex salinum]|uniref:hypothetical protein n=1 Tax=Halosimplex salinum TaxID=1710538 RepID=UPI002E268157
MATLPETVVRPVRRVMPMAVDGGLLAVDLLLVAFAGGAIGAAVGGYAAYGLAGLTITIGEIARVTTDGGGTSLVSGSADLGTAGVTGLVGYGPVLGPHVAFAGAAAAAAFAGRKGHLDTDFPYHEAKHLSTPLGPRPAALAVGGVFGILGYWLAQLSLRLALPWDPVAASVVVSALLHRAVFGYSLVGRLDTDVLDMSPYEDGDRRMATDGDGEGAQSLVGRYVVEPWLSYQSEWAVVTVLGLVVGVFGGFLAVATGSYFLAFGIAATGMLFLTAGVERFPVTHHMALPAGIAALAVPNATPVVAVLVGGGFGVLGGVLGELAQRVAYAHADTHFDPPSASIVLTTLLVAVLDIAGVFQQAGVPTLGLA